MQFNKLLIVLVVAAMAVTGCKKDQGRSNTTGWKYGDQEWGGFEKADYDGQLTGPNLVLIPGGTFTMGQTAEDVTYEWDNVARRVTVTSFYMDETEVANIDYREYLYDLQRMYGETVPEVYRKALPDTLVWREELSYNEPLVETYFRFPAFDEYPVVGVSWEQSNEYCVWRSNKVNEMILIEKGILNPNPEQKGSDVFDTKAYLAGQYEGSVRKEFEGADGQPRKVRFEDGIMLPDYRLPTEAEWEYAALALQGNASENGDELVTDRRIYPWSGNTARYKIRDKYQGQMLANFKRGRGDYMGVSAKLNDSAPVPGYVRSNYPNDFGLYNMAGNVNEWVMDVYRPLTTQDVSDVQNHDLNPFRGNEFKRLKVDEDGKPIAKDSLGRLQYEMVPDSTLENRRNYRSSDLRNFRDGDDPESVTYEFGKHSLINDESRVIKGGSWSDRLYWLQPGTRRYFPQDAASNTIGFRCAMIRIGGSDPNSMSGNGDGNMFKARKKKAKRRYN